MTFCKTLVAAGLLLAVGAMPVRAADWGGIKDIGGGVPVPVPAPAPVPTYDADSDWYVGLTFGGNLSHDAKITDTDVDDLGNTSPGVFARDSGDIGISPIFGGSFGRYITPSLRAEIAIDYSPDERISNSGTFAYNVTNSAPNLSATGGIDTNAYTVSRTDTVKLARTTGLVNLLYDIHTGTRFTPFIGGGFGFSWRRIKRDYSEAYTCLSGSNSVDPTLYGPGICSSYAAPSSSSPLSGSVAKDQIDLAAAVQAGVAYEVTESIIWDNSWQMLWEGNGISLSAPSASGQNRIEYKDSILQQFRSGLRIRFN